jgi:hypothetical protein
METVERRLAKLADFKGGWFLCERSSDDQATKTSFG